MIAYSSQLVPPSILDIIRRETLRRFHRDALREVIVEYGAESKVGQNVLDILKGR
jgi:hypothetical protein